MPQNRENPRTDGQPTVSTNNPETNTASAAATDALSVHRRAVTIDLHADTVQFMVDEGADINGQFCWVDDPLQAPIPSWGETAETQPWRK